MVSLLSLFHEKECTSSVVGVCVYKGNTVYHCGYVTVSVCICGLFLPVSLYDTFISVSLCPRINVTVVLLLTNVCYVTTEVDWGPDWGYGWSLDLGHGWNLNWGHDWDH